MGIGGSAAQGQRDSRMPAAVGKTARHRGEGKGTRSGGGKAEGHARRE